MITSRTENGKETVARTGNNWNRFEVPDNLVTLHQVWQRFRIQLDPACQIRIPGAFANVVQTGG